MTLVVAIDLLSTVATQVFRGSREKSLIFLYFSAIMYHTSQLVHLNMLIATRKCILLALAPLGSG